ncbi:hypothetical protein [Aliihoeflea sp. PC F10.4]
MSEMHPFIARLSENAAACEHEEQEFRRTMATRVATLAEARAFANRRMNLMKSLFATVAQADSQEIATAAAVAALRNRLGWRDDSDARNEVLTEYAKIAMAAYAATHEVEDDEDEIVTVSVTQTPNVEAALQAFEDWYVEARGKPFWVLFEHYMPETQLVDF